MAIRVANPASYLEVSNIVGIWDYMMNLAKRPTYSTRSPPSRRDLRRHAEVPTATATSSLDLSVDDSPGSDRARRIRDAVEAALSDIILLGTEEQVQLAVDAVHELANGKFVHT